jgi:hypothetical protein
MSRIDTIRIASPCTALWTEMSGDDRARFCGLCQKTVYDSMSIDACELERLVDQAACVRVHRDGGGRVLTRDRIARAVALAATAALAACTGADTDSATRGNVQPDTIAEVSGQRTDAPRDLPGGSVIAEAANAGRNTVEEVRRWVPEISGPALRPTMGEPVIEHPMPTLGRPMRHTAPVTPPTEPPEIGKIAPMMGAVALPPE